MINALATFMTIMPGFMLFFDNYKKYMDDKPIDMRDFFLTFASFLFLMLALIVDSVSKEFLLLPPSFLMASYFIYMKYDDIRYLISGDRTSEKPENSKQVKAIEEVLLRYVEKNIDWQALRIIKDLILYKNGEIDSKKLFENLKEKVIVWSDLSLNKSQYELRPLIREGIPATVEIALSLYGVDKAREFVNDLKKLINNSQKSDDLLNELIEDSDIEITDFIKKDGKYDITFDIF